jgi:hypothetical protein
MDRYFPLSDPRVIVPECPDNYQWPHVEPKGLLCLKALSRSASTSDRVLQTYNDAITLGSYSETLRAQEFEREFRTYWDRARTEDAPLFLSLVETGGNARQVWFYKDVTLSQYVFADGKDSLRNWLRNRGNNPSDKQFHPTALAKLESPLMPSDFPRIGGDVINAENEQQFLQLLTPGENLPLILETTTSTGVALVGLILKSPIRKDLVKGYRSINRVPFRFVLSAIESRPVIRCQVERVDGKWIHGRDHDLAYPTLRKKVIVVVGCGALGGYIGRFLAQSGIGSLVLIDSDSLVSANTSRHVLGNTAIGVNKAEALSSMLRRDFPHVLTADVYRSRFEQLSPSALNKFVNADLIISAGIDLVGDFAIEEWRESLDSPPPWICTWTEEYALAGHAVAILDKERLLARFTTDGRPAFAATSWPQGISTTVVEAGCGNSFQPHGVIDLSAIVRLAAQLSLDVLLKQITQSRRTLYLGERQRVVENGGIPMPVFSESNVTKTFSLGN